MVNDPRPFFPFYPDDFWGSEAVEAMTMEAAGLYLAVLSRCWRRGSVPADADALRALYGRRCAAWDASWAMVRPCFTERDGRLYNERMEQEREIADGLSSKASGAAKARWARWKADRDAKAMRSHSASNANAMQGQYSTEQNRTEHDRTPQSAGKPRRGRKPEVVSVSLDDLPPRLRSPDVVAAFGEFLAFRKNEKREPVTPTALRNLLLKLEPHGAARAVAALRESMANDWKGVFPERASGGLPGGLQAKPGGMREFFANQDRDASRTVDVEGGAL